MIAGSLHKSRKCREFYTSWKFLHPHLRDAKLSGALPCIRICIADVKVQTQMRMHGEWPCPKEWYITIVCHEGNCIGNVWAMGFGLMVYDVYVNSFIVDEGVLV